MFPETLSHYTMSQFFLVFVMMLLFFFTTFTGFTSFYYGKDKWLILSVQIPVSLLILSVVFVETAYTSGLIMLFIVLFRLLNICIILSLLTYMSKNKQNVLTFRLMCYSVMALHGIIFILSFYFHYTPLYLTILPTFLVGIIFRPAKLNILIDHKSSEILQLLKEAILVISADRNILSINRTMRKLLNTDNWKSPSIQEICDGLKGEKNTIEDWFNRAFTEDICFINNKYYLIQTVCIPHKGLIITASDIHEKVIIQKELEQSITDLKTLTKTLQLYSQSSEIMAIREERAMIYRHIQGIISEGLNSLNADLIKIKQKPPENYEKILFKSRSLLNEVRTIVSKWRSITGADL